MPENAQVKAFVWKFGALLVAFGLVQLLVPEFQEPAQVFFARLLESGLRLLGWAGVARRDVLVSFPGGGFAIGAECTALAPYALLVAFVLAFPASLRSRLLAIFGGAVLLFAANLVRLVSCAYVMRYRPDWFPFVHEYIWQVALVGLTFGLVALWARKVAR